MVINQRGVELIKSFESLELKAYLCPADVWTVGYGHTKTARFGQLITRARAEELLIQDLRWVEATVSAGVEVPISGNQFAALCSFVFNVGPGNFRKSSLRKLLNRSWYGQVPAQLMRWNKVDGRILSGLTRRRAAEAQLWNTPDEETRNERLV